jgi:hypothetical protein
MRRVAAALAALTLPGVAVAQVPVALELRPGAAIGQYDAARGDLDTTPRLAWRVAATISPHRLVHLVAGYGHAGFGCEGGFCIDSGTRLASAGPELGVRVGAAGERAGPWVQADVIGHAVRATWPGGDGTGSRTPGWGLAAGFHLPVGRRLALSPAARVHAYNSAMDPDPAAYRVSLATLELGLRARLR